MHPTPMPSNSTSKLSIPSLRVYPAALADAEAVAEVLTRAFHPPVGMQGLLFPLLKFSISQDIQQRLRTQHRHYCCLGAWVGPQLVGTLEISVRTIMGQRQPYISNLAVLPGWRRRGVAQRLLLGAESVVRVWGYRALHLHVMEGNQAARNLYNQLHYQVLQVTPDPWCWLGFPKQLLLSKQLR